MLRLSKMTATRVCVRERESFEVDDDKEMELEKEER